MNLLEKLSGLFFVVVIVGGSIFAVRVCTAMFSIPSEVYRQIAGAIRHVSGF